MEKRIFDFTDSRLAVNAATPYELGVVAGTDGFSFLVADPTGEVLVLKAWHFDNYDGDFQAIEAELRPIFGGELLLSAAFNRVRCAVFNRQATIVPRRLFNPDQLSAYFQLLLPAGEYAFGYEAMGEMDAFLVYAIEPAARNLLQQYFPLENTTHLAMALLRGWQALAPAGGAQVFVNLRHEVAQVGVFERRNLLFYNAFSFDTANDFLYFVLLAFDQCRFSPLEVPLMVSGELLEDSEIYRLLYRYVRDLRFVGAPERYHLPAEIKIAPAHFHFDLFSLKAV